MLNKICYLIFEEKIKKNRKKKRIGNYSSNEIMLMS